MKIKKRLFGWSNMEKDCKFKKWYNVIIKEGKSEKRLQIVVKIFEDKPEEFFVLN